MEVEQLINIAAEVQCREVTSTTLPRVPSLQNIREDSPVQVDIVSSSSTTKLSQHTIELLERLLE